MHLHRLVCSLASVVLLATAAWAQHVEVVKAGEAKVSGIYLTPSDDADDQPLHHSARDLATVIERMTGASVPVVAVEQASQVPEGPAVVLGQLTEQLGVAVRETSKWRDGVRTVVGGGRVFVAAESNQAASNGVMDLLHEQGVRWLLPENLPGNPGEIIPVSEDLSWSERDHERHPPVRSRRLWGHNVGEPERAVWRGATKWVRRNAGRSPVVVSETHAWGNLLPKKDPDPEWFAIKRYDDEGQPVRGKQFCVSNPEVAELVSRTLIERFAADPTLVSQSISPVDGGGACICLECRALDVPGYLEPSSGKPVLSDRYMYFYNQLAERVSKHFPDRYLAFYVYSDYSRVPRKYDELHPMLLPTFAPIRYPRLQSMFNPLSDQNIRLRNEINAYTQTASHIGYYGYNYNLAEMVVPFSKISIWSQDLPWLINEKKLIHLTMETFANWNTSAPHNYLSARYPYSGEDPADIMDDYFEKLGGAAAQPLQTYWREVDEAFAGADIHSGSFYGVEQVMTPQVLAGLQAHLDAAAERAETEREQQVVKLFQSGLSQGRLAVETINHLNRTEFLQAKAKRDQLTALLIESEEQNVLSEYPRRFVRSFLGQVVDAGAAILESGGEIVTVLPEAWQVRMDHYDVGIEEEWFDPARSDSKWSSVRTWGAPSLYSQGFGDFKGYQWFRVNVDVPAEAVQDLVIWFGSNDGATRLWVNGEPVWFVFEQGKKDQRVQAESFEMPHKWRAFSAPVGRLLKPGATNSIVVRIDHNLNDLNLGGILRPVLLYRPGAQEMKEIEDHYEKPVM